MNKIYRILGKKGRITIPYEIRKYVGFKQNDILSFYVQDDKSILIKREKLCDECKEETENGFDDSDSITLRGFIDGLSETQPKAAFMYLSLKNEKGKIRVSGGEQSVVRNAKKKK